MAQGMVNQQIPNPDSQAASSKCPSHFYSFLFKSMLVKLMHSPISPGIHSRTNRKIKKQIFTKLNRERIVRIQALSLAELRELSVLRHGWGVVRIISWQKAFHNPILTLFYIFFMFATSLNHLLNSYYLATMRLKGFYFVQTWPRCSKTWSLYLKDSGWKTGSVASSFSYPVVVI